MRKDHELHTRRQGRNRAMLAVLIGVVLMLFAVTIVKMGAHAGNPWG